MGPRTVRFKENDFITSNLAWDAVNGEFKMKRGDAHFAKSEESEDELNDYANYRNLDPDYVRYLKEIRRAKRRSQQQQQKQQQQQQQQYRRSQEQTVEEEDEYEEEEEEEEEEIPVPIPLTPNIGITSITNTNVLMNDTLERMKHSLNRINSQIMEKKGAGLEGEELEDLHFQLAQTEYQMGKILKIVNSAADSFNASILSPPPPAIYQRNGVNYDDSESEEDEDEIQERIEYEEEAEIVETTKYVTANRSSSSSSNSSSSASLSSISSSPYNRSSSDGTKQTTHKSNSDTKTTLNNDSNKPMLSEESLRKRRLKKKNNRKRAKLNKKNKNKSDFESKKEA